MWLKQEVDEWFGWRRVWGADDLTQLHYFLFCDVAYAHQAK
jgi:hypothetical protein